jgi:CBS domain-containing protein
METELFTVQKDDIIDLVAEMMNWRKIRYMPVENSKGHLVGLITTRLMMRHYSDKIAQQKEGKNILVKDIMIKSPISIGPSSSIVEALQIMRTQRIGCLPVVKDKELIGLITEMDFLRISGRLIERLEGGDQ